MFHIGGNPSRRQWPPAPVQVSCSKSCKTGLFIRRVSRVERWLARLRRIGQADRPGGSARRIGLCRDLGTTWQDAFASGGSKRQDAIEPTPNGELGRFAHGRRFGFKGERRLGRGQHAHVRDAIAHG